MVTSRLGTGAVFASTDEALKASIVQRLRSPVYLWWVWTISLLQRATSTSSTRPSLSTTRMPLAKRPSRQISAPGKSSNASSCGAPVILAHCIPYKGASEDQYVANLVVQAVEWLGHTRLILKADNEPALHTLVEQSLEEIRIKVRGVAQISTEHPPRYDSQSNGGVETGVRILRGHFRTLKLCLEARIGKVIPTNHALVPWLLEYAAMILAVTYVGPDGKTAWCRARGRNFKRSSLNFAELVIYKLPAKGPMHNPDDNMGSQWAEGVFLGYSRSSNTYIVHNA